MNFFDWLLLIYIFKWANFWVAPEALFCFLWFGVILASLIKMIERN